LADEDTSAIEKWGACDAVAASLGAFGASNLAVAENVRLHSTYLLRGKSLLQSFVLN